MYKPDTNQAVLTLDIKWHRFYGENVANEPTPFVFTEDTGVKKIFVRMQETRNKMIII